MTVRVETAEVRARRGPGLAVVALGILYAWVAAGFDSFTLASALAVGFPGVAGVLVAASEWPAERDGTGGRPSRWALLWLAWFVATMLWELFAFLSGASPHHPTISDLLDPPLTIHAVRAVFVFGWLVLGWKLLKR